MANIKLYEVTANSPWGDFGAVLCNGQAIDGFAFRDKLTIDCTGPFQPPIMFPVGSTAVVVNSELREALKALRGTLMFSEVLVRKVVHINWRTWDRIKSIPQEFPPGSEVESYLSEGKHSKEAASKIDHLWRMNEWGRLASGRTIRTQISWEFRLVVPHDLLANRDIGFVDVYDSEFLIVNSRGKAFLEKRAGEWVSFREVEID